MTVEAGAVALLVAAPKPLRPLHRQTPLDEGEASQGVCVGRRGPSVSGPRRRRAGPRGAHGVGALLPV